MIPKVNTDTSSHLEEFESPLPHELNPHHTRVFSFINAYGDKMGTRKNIAYKEPKLSTTGTKWFVWYSYRVPGSINPERPWQRFKVYEDINRIKTMEYAYDLLRAVKICLESGYDPFKEHQDFIKNEADTLYRKQWSINQAVLHFKTMWKERGIEHSSLVKYNRTADRFLNWCIVRGIQHEPIESVTHKHIEAYLKDAKQSGAWSNRGYNNEKDFLSTMFIFFGRDCNCPVNPVKGITNQKTSSKKHKYYDEKTFTKMKEAMTGSDPYLLFACQVVYYLCIRSEKELKLFKVKNIIEERKQVFIKAEESKTNKDRYVPMASEMLSIFKERKILDYPGDYYVFSVPHKNKFMPDGVPGIKPFGKGFFSKRFAKIRKKVGLSSDYTIFSLRHTRCVHLKMDGASDESIMNLMGHQDFSTTSKYLREIGLTVDPDAVDRKTRKF